ncbi:unnamed protein product [Rotaria sp. Silwood1]|nr:unnamed protein product [Rotaria sp. Silwood1]CAF4657846.1 unnamed protein product [Rotaria sp. Silwood1]
MIVLGGSSDQPQESMGAFQEFPQVEAARLFSKYAARISSLERVPFFVEKAVRSSIYSPSGVSYLDIPGELVTSSINSSQIEQPPKHQAPPKPAASRESLGEFFNLLKQSKKPLVIVGKGCSYGFAEEELKKFIEQYNLPFLATPMGKGTLDDRHPLSVGAARSTALKDADCIILLGARLNWMLHFGKPPRFDPDVKIIQIDTDTNELHNNVQSALAIQADLNTVLKQLNENETKWKYDAATQWWNLLRKKLAANKQRSDTLINSKDSSMLNYYSAFDTIQSIIPKDAIIVSEGANTMDIGRTMLLNSKARHRLDAGTFGTMGVGPGFAIAAAIYCQDHEPEKRIICVEGDSAFGFSGLEFETAVRYNLPIIFIIINNGGIYAGVDAESFQEMAKKDAALNLPPTSLMQANYERIAEAFGCQGYLARTQEEVKKSVQSALAEKTRPSIINVFIDPSSGRVQQNFRKRIFYQFINHYIINNKDEQQTSLLHERNQQIEGPIRNEDFQVTSFIIDPQNYLYHYWLAIITFAVAYNLLLIPARYAFNELNKNLRIFWISLDYTFDIIYLIDIFIQSRTGYFSHGLFVRNHYVLSRNYFTSRQFYLRDLLSIIPTDFLYLIPKYRFISIIRCNRFLRINRLFEFQELTESRTRFPNAFRIFCLICLTLTLIHWNSCAYLLICQYLGFGTDRWVLPAAAKNESVAMLYTYCFYWSTLLLSTIGDVPLPVKRVEYAFVLFDFMIGILIFATIIGSLGTMISSQSQSRQQVREKMDEIKRYMKFRSVNRKLEQKVIKWLDYLYTNRQVLNEEMVLNSDLSVELRKDLAIKVHLESLQQVTLFRDCESNLLIELVTKLKPIFFGPGDYVCRKGDIGKEMYIIKRGQLGVVSDDGKTTFVVLKEGSVFGEISILNIPGSKNGNRRTANVKSLGYSDLYTLTKEDLWLVLDNYPESLSKIIEKGKSILRKDNLLDESLMDSKRHVEHEQLLSIQNRIKKLIDTEKILNNRITTFFDGYVESIRQFKQQLSKMEYQFGARKQSISLLTNVPMSAPAVPFFLNQWKSNTAINLLKFRSVQSMELDD